MTTSFRKRLLLLALCVGAMAGSPDCPGTGAMRYEFDLPRALPDSFAVPDTVVSEGYMMRSIPLVGLAECRGFHTYDIRDLREGKGLPARIEVLDLRIDTTRTVVTIVMGYSPDLGGDPDYWATLASRMAVAGTGDLPRVIASRRTKIGNDKKLRAWCTAGARR